MSYALGKASIKNLEGVHPHLIKVLELAITLTEVDFTVLEGMRTAEQQKMNIASGVSWTMDSRHLTGHAVDLVPYRDTDGDGDKELSWDWPSCCKIARAMQMAAFTRKIPIVWGGCFDRTLNDLGSDMEKERQAYAERRKRFGKPVRLDGPHFELFRKSYP